MKSFIKNRLLPVLIVLSLTGSFRLNSQSIQRVTPIPTENTIMCIYKIPGSNSLVATGEHSTVLFSEDGGDTWTQVWNDDMFYFFTAKSTFFFSQNTGYILDDHGVFRIDEGNWDYTVLSSSTDLCQVIFISQDKGFCIGLQGTLYKTIDGGENWTSVATGLSIDFNSIAFCDENTGYIIGSSTGQSLKTDDGGETWSIVSFFPSYTNSGLQNIVFTDETTGYLTMDDLSGLSSDFGRIYKTTDAGESWQEVFSLEDYHPVSMAFYDETTGSVAFENDQNQVKVFYINSNNTLWTESDLPDILTKSMNSICYLDQASAIMGGYAGQIYRTSDSGQSWVPDYERLFYGNISNFQFTNDTTGYLKVWNSFELKNEVFKTTDGGENWDVVSNEMMQYVDFINSDTGFACYFVNDQLDILKTTDGGENWINVSNIACYCQNLVDFDFYDDMNGLITTIMGPFLKTSDGGITWYEVYNNSNPYWHITYKNADEVFLGGWDGNGTTQIKKSNDGGNTWETYDIGNYGPGLTIFFKDSLTAYFPVLSDVILKSVNGGESWYEVPIEDPENTGVHLISFSTPDTGYALGYGRLFKTTDAGESWDLAEQYPTVPYFTGGFIFNKENSGYIIGSGGVMLKIDDSVNPFNPPQNFEVYSVYLGYETEFFLSWEAPDTSNTTGFAGYNVYRYDSLIEYTVFTEFAEILPPYWGGLDQMCYYVTAVYINPDGESEPTEELCDYFLTGIDDHIKNEDFMRVESYPNPFTGDVHFSFAFQDNKYKGELQIFDIKGDIILSINIDSPQKTISFCGLKAGIYFYRVLTESGMSQVRKMVKL